MSIGVWVALIAVAVVVAFGAYRARTDGRFRGRSVVSRLGRGAPSHLNHRGEPVETTWTHVTAALPGAALGQRATLLQFSSAFCAPCRVTRRILGEVANIVPGVQHLEVDAEQHLELVRTLGVLRTPTTLIIDREGREVTRAAGAPRKEQVLAALDRL